MTVDDGSDAHTGREMSLRGRLPRPLASAAYGLGYHMTGFQPWDRSGRGVRAAQERRPTRLGARRGGRRKENRIRFEEECLRV